MTEEKSPKEKRIRSITSLYYSRNDVQKAIFDFCKNREVAPRYFEGFGKRPDSFEFKTDVFELVKKGATSFHCSEELWTDPLEIKTGMKEEEANSIRQGWDLLIDIDCKYFDFSKKAAQAIIRFLKKHNVKNISVKFSGSKGFHILIPWKSFPKELGGENTKNLFPSLPRKIISYIRQESEKEMREILPENFESQFKESELKRGIKCNNCGEIAEEFLERHFRCSKCKREEVKKIRKDSSETKETKCPDCKIPFQLDETNSKTIYECKKCGINSEKNPNNFSRDIETDIFELMGLDLVLVSPRHLFRTPYSLHEKTSLASVVIPSTEEAIENFDMKDANPLKVKVSDFMPEAEEEEAKELVLEALDWYKRKQPEENQENKNYDKATKPIEISEISEKLFPPCIKKILKGMSDGKKRALFVLINFFRMINLEKQDIEKKIYDWNEKNDPPLRKGYIKSQISWSFRRNPLLPPNCRDFYQGLGVCEPDKICESIKNPVKYVVKRNFSEKSSKKKAKKENNKKT